MGLIEVSYRIVTLLPKYRETYCAVILTPKTPWLVRWRTGWWGSQCLHCWNPHSSLKGDEWNHVSLWFWRLYYKVDSRFPVWHKSIKTCAEENRSSTVITLLHIKLKHKMFTEHLTIWRSLSNLSLFSEEDVLTSLKLGSKQKFTRGKKVSHKTVV